MILYMCIQDLERLENSKRIPDIEIGDDFEYRIREMTNNEKKSALFTEALNLLAKENLNEEEAECFKNNMNDKFDDRSIFIS